MKDIKELALQVAEEINMKYADLNGDGLPGFCEELCTRFLAAYLKEQSAPSSEEVREMLARLNAVGNTSLEYAAADMIERLAARVPDDRIATLEKQRDELLVALELCKFDSLNMSLEDLGFIRSVVAKVKP